MTKRIYGPVPSRRLGHSLGVDCVPFKTCSYDCIYCQLGRNPKTTIDRQPYIPIDPVLEELKKKLSRNVHIDYITLGGSGEPTLHCEIGTLISEIKTMTDIPVAVLTNGSLLGNAAVQQSLMKADVVLPSLDAHDEKGFEKINRPHPSIAFDAMVAGLVSFGQAYPGQVWLEVFILNGINDTEKDAFRFKELIDRIHPDKIHLNTAVRPTAERDAVAVSGKTLEMFCAVFGEKAEVAVKHTDPHEKSKIADIDQELLSLLARRPCTLDDLATGLHADKEAISAAILRLSNEGKIKVQQKGTNDYYQLARHGSIE